MEYYRNGLKGHHDPIFNIAQALLVKVGTQVEQMTKTTVEIWNIVVEKYKL